MNEEIPDKGSLKMDNTTSQKDREGLLDAVRRMASLAEFYDPNILKHIERIRGYSLIVARSIGMSEEEAEVIAYACQLHDIGMVGVPEEIINKTGGLADEDWAIIKKHPEMGAEILDGSPVDILQIGKVISLTHHERWDGSGYPQGLKGEGIPVGGRICGLVDVFDTVTTKRAYKNEVSVDVALHLVQESSGTFFDPELVEAFSKNFEEILKIRWSHI